MISIGGTDQEDFPEMLYSFISDTLNRKLELIVAEKIDTIQLRKELEQAFKHYKYYFPNKEIPEIYTCISGFNQSVFTSTDYIGISLEKYLGANFPLYTQLGIEQYMQQKMHKDMIPVDCMRAWCTGEFPYNDSVNTLLSYMIYEGKIQYFLDAMLPDVEDSLKWGYSDNKFKWAQTYEQNIWDYLIEQKLLFSDKIIDIRNFTGESAFTNPFQQVSAPRAGTYIGYRIVLSYMKNNKDLPFRISYNAWHQEGVLLYAKRKK